MTNQYNVLDYLTDIEDLPTARASVAEALRQERAAAGEPPDPQPPLA